MTIQYNETLDIAVANTARASKWQNKRTTWSDIVETLKQTERTGETLKQYFSYSKDKQGEIKDVGGFVGGYLREGRRRNGYVEFRQLVALDVDYGALDVWEVFTMLDVAGLMYTTHKHTPAEPRLRIVFPLDRKVNADEYEAIARVVANWLGIDNFDDTTYQPTRLMYYPSTAKDGEYLYDFTDAPFMCADDVLAELPNWQDPTTWPVSSRVKEAVKTSRADKVEDPHDKEGIVGAFCRAFPMYDALAEFLDEVYTPCEELGQDRYSYVEGSTSGGLIVYDNKLAYSHHSTDIAGGKLCNAFDLVRLHKFADLDEKSKTEDVTRLPSYKAMADFASKLKAVKREIISHRRHDATDYDELEDQAREVAESDDWIESLTMVGKTSVVESTIDNAVIILNNDENLKGRLRFNEHSLWEDVVKPFLWDKDVYRYPRALNDTDINHIKRYMQKAYGVSGKETIQAAVDISAHENGYNPLKNYLDKLPKWDGESRVETLLPKLFGAEDTPYVRAVTLKTLCAAVRRVYYPGTKFDYVLILIGDQGQGKSTFLSMLGGDWYTDNVKITTDDRNNLEIMRGKWILEIAELRGFNKTEAEFSKGFISRTEDIYRRVFKTRDIIHPRQSIFIGTHNKSDFLHDETGNRRYWPVNFMGKKGPTDVWEYLKPEVVVQIWAEAKERDEPLYLTKELEAEARIVQGQHLETDAWEEDILTFLEGKDEVSTKEIWDMALLGGKPINKMEQNRIGKIMRLTGSWEYKRVSVDNVKYWKWVKK